MGLATIGVLGLMTCSKKRHADASHDAPNCQSNATLCLPYVKLRASLRVTLAVTDEVDNTPCPLHASRIPTRMTVLPLASRYEWCRAWWCRHRAYMLSSQYDERSDRIAYLPRESADTQRPSSRHTRTATARHPSPSLLMTSCIMSQFR